MTSARATKVLKKIEPGQPVALKWAQRYGPSLLCVRYRLEPAGTQRLTTVELVVDCCICPWCAWWRGCWCRWTCRRC